MNEYDASRRRSSRRKLLMLIGIATAPILLSIGLFRFFPELQPENTTNRGQLINPPVQVGLIEEALKNYDVWLLIQPVDENCDTDCKQMLYLSRQVITGLGKDSDRVARIVIPNKNINISFRQHLVDEHPDVRVMPANSAPLTSIASASPSAFLVDPNGNVMMFYTLETSGRPMLKDLKHLLKISNIG